MSSSVCQGLSSCLEARVADPLILMSKTNFSHPLACAQKPNMSENHEQEENFHNRVKNNNKFDFNNGKNHENSRNLGGWNFIQELTNIPHNRKQGNQTEHVYVHPLGKRSSCTLSKKSLEMCTESLGSETGSDISENVDKLTSTILQTQSCHYVQRSKPQEPTNKQNRTVNFPPPLTSISGSDGLKVRPHREGGRLVIKAITISSSRSCFQAERADGRLRLSLLKDSDMDSENADQAKEEYYIDDDDDDDGDSDADGNGGVWDGDMKFNGGKVECEVGVGDFGRPSRCKEGGNENKGLANWGTCWVAIS